MAAPAGAAEWVPGEVVVAYEAGVDGDARSSARHRLGARVERSLGVRGAQLLRLAPGTRVGDAVARLRRDPAVRYAEPNYVVSADQAPDDGRFTEQWALRNTGQQVFGPAGVPGADVDALGAWALTGGSADVTVAVIDTGVAGGHPDLAGALLPGWDFVDGDAGAADANGHGTHVAAIVAARRGNGHGVAGVAPGVRILPVRALDDRGSGTTATISEAISYAAAQGADVINASFGGPQAQVMAEAIAAAPQALFVAAAGNRTADHDGRLNQRAYPCDFTFEHLVCVAASDARDELAGFSDRGRWSVDLAAPGYGILSAQPHVETLLREDFETPAADRWTPSGTLNDWRQAPEFALVNAHGIGSTAGGAAAPGGGYVMPDSWMTSTAAFDLGDARRPCRLAVDVDTALNGPADSLRLMLQTPGDWPTLAWQGVARTRAQIQFDGEAPGSRIAWNVQRGLLPGRAAIDDIWLRCLRLDRPADGYDFLSGTSMAAPMVAGVAALRLSLHPGETPEQVRAAVLAGAERLPQLAGATATGARLDARGALEASPAPPPAPPSGRIETIAGPADGLDFPVDVDRADDGSLLIAETGPDVARVLRRTPDGRLVTVAGTGTRGFSGDGGPATAAQLSAVTAVDALPDGGFLLVDSGAVRVRRVFPDGRIDTVAGTGRHATTGDGGPAVDASLSGPRGVAAMPDGGFTISVEADHRVRRVWPDGTISTVAGGCDGGPDDANCIAGQYGIAALPDGGWMVGDQRALVLRMTPSGRLDVVAGSEPAAFGGDGGPALGAAFGQVTDVTPLPDGGFAIADAPNHRVRRVTPDGRVWTVAGSAVAGFSGDGGAAARARLETPAAVTDAPGGLVVVDSGNHRLRFVELPAGTPPGPDPTPTPDPTPDLAPTPDPARAPDPTATVPGASGAGGPTERRSVTPSRLTTRVAPRWSQLHVTVRRLPSGAARVKVRGRLKVPSGVPPERGCSGAIAISIKRGRRSLATSTIAAGTDCRFSTAVALRRSRVARARRVAIALRFKGNAVLTPIRHVHRERIR